MSEKLNNILTSLEYFGNPYLERIEHHIDFQGKKLLSLKGSIMYVLSTRNTLFITQKIIANYLDISYMSIQSHYRHIALYFNIDLRPTCSDDHEVYKNTNGFHKELKAYHDASFKIYSQNIKNPCQEYRVKHEAQKYLEKKMLLLKTLSNQDSLLSKVSLGRRTSKTFVCRLIANLVNSGEITLIGEYPFEKVRLHKNG